MITISRETYQRLYDEYKNGLLLVKIVSIASPVIMLIVIIASDSFMVGFLGLLIALFPLLLAAYFRKKLIPAGHGKKVQEVMTVMKYDLCSDKLVDLIVRKINETSEFCERTRLMLLLSTVYSMRGYPDVGLSFFNELIDVYMNFDDYENAKAAYADAESFIREYHDKNFVYCTTAVSLLVNANLAYGNYTDALIMQTIYNDMNAKFESSEAGKQNSGTPMQKFLVGVRYLQTAEIYYRLGDLEQSAKYVDMGGPLLSPVPYMIGRANKLSGRIREQKNG